jgi:hypothetical protein
VLCGLLSGLQVGVGQGDGDDDDRPQAAAVPAGVGEDGPAGLERIRPVGSQS